MDTRDLVWRNQSLVGVLASGASRAEEEVDHDALLAGKIAFLNPGFFTIRITIYFAIWIGLSWFLFRTSTKQDESQDPQLTLRMERLSAPGMILFALSTNFAAFDILMSLDPHWFSTIFGVYYFASSVVIFFAMMAIILLGLIEFWAKGNIIKT